MNHIISGKHCFSASDELQNTFATIYKWLKAKATIFCLQAVLWSSKSEVKDSPRGVRTLYLADFSISKTDAVCLQPTNQDLVQSHVTSMQSFFNSKLTETSPAACSICQTVKPAAATTTLHTVYMLMTASAQQNVNAERPVPVRSNVNATDVPVNATGILGSSLNKTPRTTASVKSSVNQMQIPISWEKVW